MDRKAFIKLSKPRRAVAIARDVLAQLNRFGTQYLGYVMTKDASNHIPIKSGDQQVHTLFSKQKECCVCGIGAMFICAVERADGLKVNQLHHFSPFRQTATSRRGVVTQTVRIDRIDIVKYLAETLGAFSALQLTMIENYYEGSSKSFITDHHDNWKDAVWLNGRKDRLRLIMQNIIVNKGVFDTKSSWPVRVVTEGDDPEWQTPGFHQ